MEIILTGPHWSNAVFVPGLLPSAFSRIVSPGLHPNLITESLIKKTGAMVSDIHCAIL